MARKVRIELEGGLYHVITRGNDRQVIFHSAEDHRRFLSLLAKQKERFGFFLYAYCLMSNHIHLLIERQAEGVGAIMQRVLTGYSQYYNRKYRHVGHVFQGRLKAILCQSDQYLTKLVRYIHLNPVRAKMVEAAVDYPYSSHHAYCGLDPARLVDVDPVLRHFGSNKDDARRHFVAYVDGGVGIADSDEKLYTQAEGDILGSEEFVDATIHRLGHVEQPSRKDVKDRLPFNAVRLVAAVEGVFGMPSDQFCGAEKNARAVMAKEVLILVGREAGATVTQLSVITGLDTSTVSRRHDAAKVNAANDRKMEYARVMVARKYYGNIAESQA